MHIIISPSLNLGSFQQKQREMHKDVNQWRFFKLHESSQFHVAKTKTQQNQESSQDSPAIDVLWGVVRFGFFLCSFFPEKVFIWGFYFSSDHHTYIKKSPAPRLTLSPATYLQNCTKEGTICCYRLTEEY